jgi:hypothetical protein
VAGRVAGRLRCRARSARPAEREWQITEFIEDDEVDAEQLVGLAGARLAGFYSTLITRKGRVALVPPHKGLPLPRPRPENLRNSSVTCVTLAHRESRYKCPNAPPWAMEGQNATENYRSLDRGG